MLLWSRVYTVVSVILGLWYSAVSLTVIVRSRKDADAVEAAIERFYPDWGVRVRTLHGARSLDRVLDELGDLGDGFYVVLLGREDERVAERLKGFLPPNAVVHVVPRARVRNARLELIAWELARARTRLRSTVWWCSGGYLFSSSGGDGCRLLVEGAEPSYEPFLGLGRVHQLLSRLIGVDVPRTPLIVRTRSTVHEVYGGDRLVARLDFTDKGLRPRVLEIHGGGVDVDVNDVVRVNRRVLEVFEKTSIGFLRSLESFDTVIVPWSGGKDSTAALLLSLKAFGARRVVAVFTDTGTEFPETIDYVERVSRMLGVRVHRAYAGIDRELLEGRRPLPTHDDRWCTGLKIAATERAVAELAEGRTLVVLGDRDAESPRRSSRPPVRRSGVEEVVYAAPLRFWSAAHVQLYLVSNGIPLNPLYELGFYRIGCYMCPSLRSWELYIILSTRLYYELIRSPVFRRFIWKRVHGSR